MELQFITHFTDTYSYYDSARMALEGGCRWIQLRMKDTPVDEVEREAIRLQGLCKDYGATFIIDDHVELPIHESIAKNFIRVVSFFFSAAVSYHDIFYIHSVCEQNIASHYHPLHDESRHRCSDCSSRRCAT